MLKDKTLTYISYTNVDDTLIHAFEKLNSESNTLDMINNIISFIDLFKSGKYSPM